MVPAFVIVLYSASSSLLWVSTVCHYMVVLVNGRFLRPPCQQSSRRTTYSQTLRRRARRQPSNWGQRMSFQQVGRYRYRYFFVSHVLSISKGNNNPQTGCDSKGRGGFQLQYLAWTPLDDWVAWGKDFPTKVQRPDLVEEQVRNVTQEYDFLAVTERMDESVVTLQLLLGLNVGDVLSTSSKVGGAFDYHGKERGCLSIQKAHSSPVVREYLESDEWQALNYVDYLLYAAANRSLDLTIDRLGRDRFDNALQIYRAAMTTVSDECASETFFPCSREGIAQVDLAQSSCYNGDEGCGYRCIDRLVHDHGW